MRKDGLVIQLKITYTADHSSFQVSLNLENKEACARNIWGWIEEKNITKSGNIKGKFESNSKRFFKCVLLRQLSKAVGENCEISRFTASRQKQTNIKDS